VPTHDPVYADHHATSPLSPEALEAMRPWLAGLSGNPSATHALGRAARRAIEEARAEVAKALGASPSEIVFTSGGTESDNLAVRGAALAAREKTPGRTRLLVTAAEHDAVREAVRALAPLGFSMTELPVDADGLPRADEAERTLDETVAVVSAILANNETGAVNDHLPELAALGRSAGAIFHTDAVQAVGKIPVDVGGLGADLLSLTAHKFGGPAGVGALWVRPGVRLVPLCAGGGQERGRRAGTENVAAIVGLAAALKTAVGRMESEGRRLSCLRDRLEAGLAIELPKARFNATADPSTRRLPTCSSVALPGTDGEMLVLALDLEGICVSTGSACHAGTSKPSRVLLACGLSPEAARCTLRFSFGWTTREADIDRLLEAVPRLARQVRGAVPA